LPQKNPDFYQAFFKSFNVPEFMIEPVKLSVKDFAKTLQEKAIQATMSGNHAPLAAEPDKSNIY